MNTLLQTLISTVIGVTFIVNGVAMKSEDMIASATEAVNGANLHQIATVLEVYYMNHDEYPEAKNGEELIDIFAEEGLIRNRPIDGNVFLYERISGGQDFKLSIK